MGVRSIRLANVPLLCKLTLDILTQRGPSLAIRDRYFFMDGSSQNFHRASSI